MIKRTMTVFVMILIIFIAIWTRAFIGSMNNFAKGEAFYVNKQYIKAITFFDRSMHWYTPFNPYIEKSAEYLWEIGGQAEKNIDNQLSLISIETIRNSFYSSRSFYSPGVPWIKRCDDRIRNITKNQDNNILKGSGGFNDQDRIYEQNIVYNDPAIFWTVVLEIGLFGWIGAMIGFIFVCSRPCLNCDKYIHKYWFWILLAIINYGLWVLGTIKA
jgi:hypothetical protein